MNQQKLRKYDFNCCQSFNPQTFVVFLSIRCMLETCDTFFSFFFFLGGQTPWTSLNTNSPWCDDTVNHPETLGWWTPSMSSQLHPVFSHDADASHPAGFPAAFLEISAPGISYQNLYLRLLFNGSRGGRYQTHNHFCKAEKAPFEFDIIEMIILKSNESTFLWPIF